MSRKQVAVVAALVAAAAVLVLLVEDRNSFFDSRVYQGAMEHWFRDGGMVYDWKRGTTPYGFTYPPFAGLLMAPLAYLPIGVIIPLGILITLATTGLVVWWLVRPIAQRRGRPVPFVLAVAFCLAVIFEPVRETLTLGQINTILLAVVAADLLHGRRWTGIGIGLATAVKLTPGIFIVYLLVTRRWRAAGIATGTAAAATLLAAAIFPAESRRYWTEALWDTGRVGVLDYVSNQSLRGWLARLPIDSIAPYAWIVLVLAALAVWAWRVRRTPDDPVLGLALTGVLMCLISPVTWVHHGVWLIPALVLCLDDRRRVPLGVAAYLIMTSGLLWLWEFDSPPGALLGANLYVYCAAALLLLTPPRAPVSA